MMPQFEQNATGMRRIDRLRWDDRICFVSYGLRIGVRTNRPELLAILPSLLLPDWRPARSPRVDYLYSLWAEDQTPAVHHPGNHLLYGNATRLARSPDLEDVLARFESHLHPSSRRWRRKPPPFRLIWGGSHGTLDPFMSDRSEAGRLPLWVTRRAPADRPGIFLP
jgi:hypothetical protein